VNHESMILFVISDFKKFGTLFVRLRQLHQILTNYQTLFTVKIRRTFVIILLQKIPPHLKCIATLPCEMSMY